MTEADFKIWFKTHRAAFPEMDSWLGKLPNKDEVLTNWRNVMRDVEFSDACYVSQEMGSGDQPPPRVFGDTARDVRRLANARKVPVVYATRRSIDGQETFRCHLCRDDGWVLCWHARAVKYLRQVGAVDDTLPLARCVVACSCSAGDRRLGQKWADEIRRRNIEPPRYDEAVWCRIARVRLADQKNDLAAWYRGTAIVADQTTDNFEWRGAPVLTLQSPDDAEVEE